MEIVHFPGVLWEGAKTEVALPIGDATLSLRVEKFCTTRENKGLHSPRSKNGFVAAIRAQILVFGTEIDPSLNTATCSIGLILTISCQTGG